MQAISKQARAQAKAALEKDRIKGDITHCRAYVPQNHVAIAQFTQGENKNLDQIQFLATSGISPCVGIVAHGENKKDIITLLAHFDSSSKGQAKNYLGKIAEKISQDNISAVTIIPSRVSLRIASPDVPESFSVWQDALLKGGSSTEANEEEKASHNLYDELSFAAKEVFSKDKVHQIAFRQIEDTEDVCVNIQTGEIKRYLEKVDFSDKEDPNNISRNKLHIVEGISLYYFEAGKLEPVKFAEEGKEQASPQEKHQLAESTYSASASSAETTEIRSPTYLL